jgi:hypothetical protein
MRTFNIFLTYLQAFILGTYFASEFKFNKPVEPFLWIIISILFVLGLIRIYDERRR